MDKNISEVNAWLTKRMNVFKAKEGEKVPARMPKAGTHKSGATQKVLTPTERTRKNKNELDHYKMRVSQLRDESNALYKDLITLKKNRSELYETFAKENNEAITQMIYEIHKAEDEITSLEHDIEFSDEDKEKHKDDKKSALKDGNGKDDVIHPVDKEIFRGMQEEAREALNTFKDIVNKIKEQLANFHNYVSAMHVECYGEKHGDQPQNTTEIKKKERMKKYDTLLKELGLKVK